MTSKFAWANQFYQKNQGAKEMARIRGKLKWDRARSLGWAIAADGTVYYVRRKNFRQPPIVDLRDGMVLEFS
jgi:hypothetical protein